MHIHSSPEMEKQFSADGNQLFIFVLTVENQAAVWASSWTAPEAVGPSLLSAHSERCLQVVQTSWASSYFLFNLCWISKYSRGILELIRLHKERDSFLCSYHFLICYICPSKGQGWETQSTVLLHVLLFLFVEFPCLSSLETVNVNWYKSGPSITVCDLWRVLGSGNSI